MYCSCVSAAGAQGKAAIDVVCNPLGKSGGSAIQQLMIIGFGSLAASTPYLGAILLAVVLAWLAAASSLNKQVRLLAFPAQLLSYGQPLLRLKERHVVSQQHGATACLAKAWVLLGRIWVEASVGSCSLQCVGDEAAKRGWLRRL